MMGIVNVTPDSFSDGGIFFESHRAVEHGLRLVEEGADILDIGGESTRPGAEIVSEQEELGRVIPVIERLVEQTDVPVSIDTVKPEVAKAALEAGASIINDVAANREDSEMWKLVAESGAGYIAMHMQGTPKTMQAKPTYTNVAEEVANFFEDRIERVQLAGVKPEQIILDPGIGFGKTPDHNLELLVELNRFSKLERPVLLGASRKSFIGKLFDLPVNERVHASIACACWAVENGVQIIRTHDVRATVQAVRMTEAILSSRRQM